MNPAPATVAEQLEVRRRLERAFALSLTPAQRLEAMWGLIARSWETLRANPAGLDHFRRRNFKARAVGSREGRRVNDP
jgi:hypothetical protein